MQKLAYLFCCLLIVIATTVTVFAQGTASRVTGTVLDPKGAAVPGATVTLTNEATKVSFNTETTSSGTYAFDAIQVGVYTVMVEKTGFKKFVSANNKVDVNQPTTVNVNLEVGDLNEVVQVTAVAEVVQTSSSGNFGQTVEQRTLETLPIVGTRGRNPLNFINLQPGVVSGANIGGGVHVHGSRDRAFNFTLDGIDINETSAGGSNFAPLRTNPDMLAEFRVITSNPTAEFGRSSGGQVAMVTRPGTNDFHGTAFEFYRTPRFNANEYEANIDGRPKPQYVQHIAGGSFGGPVWIPKIYDGHNRTFFFTNLQILRTRETRVVTSTTYTQLARQGMFRYVKGAQNGAAGTSNASVDAQGNILPGVNIGTYSIAANDPAGKGLDPVV